MGLLAAEGAILGLLLLALGFVVFVYGRRRVIGHGSDVLNCGYRLTGAYAWRPGLLRMSGEELQILPLLGWTARARYSLRRRSLELISAQPLEDEGGLASIIDQMGPGGLCVPTTGRSTDTGELLAVDIAVGSPQYTALRYWVEAAPPTQRPLA